MYGRTGTRPAAGAAPTSSRGVSGRGGGGGGVSMCYTPEVAAGVRACIARLGLTIKMASQEAGLPEKKLASSRFWMRGKLVYSNKTAAHNE